MQVEVKVELVNMFDIWIISRTQEFVSSGVLSSQHGNMQSVEETLRLLLAGGHYYRVSIER